MKIINFITLQTSTFYLGTFYLGTFFLVLMYSSPALAVRQYRCAGMIQYRPCNDNRSIPALLIPGREEKISEFSQRAQMRPGVISPTVFSTKYEYSAKNSVGVWRGFVHGDGPVVLKLRLNVPGVPPEIRYMGKAELRGKVSPFEFRSTPPKGSRWSWQIFAKSEDS